MDGVAKLNLGNQGTAQPASPVSGLTVKQPVIKSITKTGYRSGRGGGKYTYQEVLATKDMRSPPSGFKRKSDTPRNPEYNVFVSNNYQD